jgi:hypothetical protein
MPTTNALVQGPDTTLELLSGDRKLQLAVQVMHVLLVFHMCVRVLRCCLAVGRFIMQPTRTKYGVSSSSNSCCLIC